MRELEKEVREEVEEVHRFFVDWFNGTAEVGALDKVLVPRLDDRMFFVSPDGNRLDRNDVVALLQRAHGTNPAFRIDIRDVTLLREEGQQLLITYTEWQRSAETSDKSENARVTTLLLTKERPFRWLHVHETWLPEVVRAEGSYDF